MDKIKETIELELAQIAGKLIDMHDSKQYEIDELEAKAKFYHSLIDLMDSFSKGLQAIKNNI